MGDLLGYARVSTTEQKAHLQTDALKKAGCIRVWTDKASGSLDHRPKLEAVLDHLRPGDTLVVWRLDRLGRNLRHLIATVNDLAAAGVGFRSLTEGIDTTTPSGRLTFHLFGALAEFERELIRERTAAGLAAARARGRSGGRPRVMTPEKLAVARQMYDSRGHTLAAIAAVVGVSRSTLYRYLGDQGRPELSPKSSKETRAKRGWLETPYHTVGTRPDLVTRLSLVTRGSARTFAVATISRSHGSGNAALPMLFDSIAIAAVTPATLKPDPLLRTSRTIWSTSEGETAPSSGSCPKGR